MAALNMLRRLAVLEVHLLCELEGYPYAVVAVDRISIGRHRWCIFHLQNDGSVTKVLIERLFFRAGRSTRLCGGVIVSVLFYIGLNSDGRLSCRILI